MSNYDNTINHVSKLDFLNRVFVYLGIGMGLNAVGAFAGSIMLRAAGGLYAVLVLGMIIAEFVLTFVMSSNLSSRSTSSVRGMYIAYSLINGFTLSIIFEVYTTASILMAFVTTAVVFGSLAVIGKTTKIDLSRFGTMFMVGLISCIVISLFNMVFFRASGIDLFLCYVETLLFMGLIAYDTQMIDRYYAQSENENYAIFAALQLELDFINLLLRVLQLFGHRRDD